MRPARPLLLYVAVAALLCAPALAHPTRLALGHPDTDTGNHLWGYWHVGQSLASGRSILEVSGLVWPRGGQLYFIDLWGALLTAPLQALGGPVLAYNLGLCFNLALAGVGAWALARRLGLGEAAAAFAGLGYQTCPHLLGQIYDGISETAATGWLPLALAGALAWRDAPGRRTALAAGLALAGATLASFYYGMFSALAVGGLLGARLLARPRTALRTDVWRTAPIVALAAALPVLPAALAFRASLDSPDALVTREPGFVVLTLVGHNMTDLWSFFRPGRTYSPDLYALFDEALIVVVYAGWTLLVGAALAWRGRRDGRVRGLMAGALASFALALGPYLYVGGRYLSLPELGPIPLPFLALLAGLPGFSRISHAFRFAVPLGLCLALLAACWIDRRRRPGRWALGLAAVWGLELVLLSPAVLPLPVTDTLAPAVYAAIPGANPRGYATAPAQAAVLDLPISLQVLARSRYAWWQAQHGLGIPYGLNDPTPTALLQNRLALALINAERSSLDTLGPRLPTLDLVVGARALAAQGYRAIVLHRALVPPTIRDKLQTLLAIAVGPGQDIGPDTLFLLPDPGLADARPRPGYQDSP